MINPKKFLNLIQLDSGIKWIQHLLSLQKCLKEFLPRLVITYGYNYIGQNIQSSSLKYRISKSNDHMMRGEIVKIVSSETGKVRIGQEKLLKYN